MKRRSLLLLVVVLAVGGLLGADAPIRAEEQDGAAEFRVGMTAAFSGPNKSIGIRVRSGIEAYFRVVNESGGVHGRKLRLVTRDDGYDPSRAKMNTEDLIDNDGVIALLGNVGTPTAEKTVPVARDRGVLTLGAITGGGLLRGPNERYIVNVRASYADETAAMVEGLLEAGIRPHEIAFFTQRDAFGECGYNGALKALERAGFEHAQELAHGRYQRSSLDIEAGLLTIVNHDITPRAIIMVGAYAPCAKFIRIARRALPETFFLNVSFVSVEALSEALEDDMRRVIVTDVMPSPLSDTPICREYRTVVERLDPVQPLDVLSLEGFVVAKTFVQALERAGPNATRESLIDALPHTDVFDADLRPRVEFFSLDASKDVAVWPTILVDGKLEPVDWKQLCRAKSPAPTSPPADPNDEDR